LRFSDRNPIDLVERNFILPSVVKLRRPRRFVVGDVLPIEQPAARLSSSLVIGAYVGSRIVGMIGLKRELGRKHEHKGLMWGFYVERSESASRDTIFERTSGI
jgi:hypothetical protein